MVITRKNLFGKLDELLFKSLEGATTLCKLRGNYYVELVHWLSHLIQESNTDISAILRHFEIDILEVQQDFSKSLSALPIGANAINDLSAKIESAIETAWMIASIENHHHCIRSGDLIMALISNAELSQELYKLSPRLKKIELSRLVTDLSLITRESIEQEQHASELIHGGALPGQSSAAIAANTTTGLAQYSTDITALAKQGKLDPVLGREKEIAIMLDILQRRRQNNPLLAGEAGVGKTAVVEGLALAIAAGNVPPPLKDVRLLALDIVALSAGASMKGEFEARLKMVLEEAVQSDQPVILFIDEVHTLMGAGGNAGTGDAANLMKPMLARGQLRTIGATTWSEYKKYIEKDPALTRRFQVLQVEEPDEQQAIAMLRGLIPVLEKHHDVWITEQALRAAVTLSHRYIPSRQLPDKAISVLDTACARVSVAQHAPPVELQLFSYQVNCAKSELEQAEKSMLLGYSDETRLTQIKRQIAEYQGNHLQLETHWQQQSQSVTQLLNIRKAILQAAAEDHVDRSLETELKQIEQKLTELREGHCLVPSEVSVTGIASIVSDWTGIPVGQMLQDDASAVMALPHTLSQRVVGQHSAVKLICRHLQMARAGLADSGKPYGVFMLAGPSGVGKTETALGIAEQLYGGEHNLITINMSEYQEAHTTSALKGSPPGYVGYGEGGVLTEAVRRKPYSVILLDEIEKAHSDVHELFYQVFDKGVMEDGEGRRIDFSNTVIIMTSNAGSELISTLCADEETQPDYSALTETVQVELLKHFPAAFLGRISIIPYLPLSEPVIRNIIDIQLKRVSDRVIKQHELEMVFTDDVVNYIIQSCQITETGARSIIRFIEKNLLPEVAIYILNNKANNIDMHGKIIVSHKIEEGLSIICE